MQTPQLQAQQLLTHAVNLHRAGNFRAAVDVYRQLLRQFPNNPDLLDRLGSALVALGQPREARQHIERAIKLAPNQAMLHHDLHLTYKWEGRMADAHKAIDRALKLSPRHPAFTAAKAELHYLEGDNEAAMRRLEPVLGQGGEVPAVALVFGLLAPRVGREAEAIETLQALLKRDDVPPAARLKGQFSLAFLLDRLGRVDEAFAAAQLANQLRQARWDSAAHTAAVDAAIAAWTPEAIKALPMSDADAGRCVFVVGMPRSGQWLAERMVSSLPGGKGAGELNDIMFLARELQGGAGAGLPTVSRLEALTAGALATGSRNYLDRLLRLDPNATRVVDRLTLNFANLGLISRLLPGARVIHCTQDPADACLSCWLTLFQGNMPFAYDLATLGKFHRDYTRLMAHWKQVLDLPILEVSYEDMVRDRPGTARRIADFVDLPWDDAAASETGQGADRDAAAREGLLHAIGRAGRYGGRVAGLGLS